MLEKFTSPADRQMFLMLIGIAVTALNKKLGLELDPTAIGEMLGAIVAAVVASKAANAHVAGKEAAAKVATVTDAAAVLSQPAPTEVAK